MLCSSTVQADLDPCAAFCSFCPLTELVFVTVLLWQIVKDAKRGKSDILFSKLDIMQIAFLCNTGSLGAPFL